VGVAPRTINVGVNCDGKLGSRDESVHEPWAKHCRQPVNARVHRNQTTSDSCGFGRTWADVGDVAIRIRAIATDGTSNCTRAQACGGSVFSICGSACASNDIDKNVVQSSSYTSSSHVAKAANGAVVRTSSADECPPPTFSHTATHKNTEQAHELSTASMGVAIAHRDVAHTATELPRLCALLIWVVFLIDVEFAHVRPLHHTC